MSKRPPVLPLLQPGTHPVRRALAALLAAAALPLAASCSSSSGGGSAGQAPIPQVTLRLGFVADVTQTTVLIGIRQKIFARAIGKSVALRAIGFRTDAAEEAALEAGELDAAYASTGTILAAVRAKGAAFLRIVSGVTAGGTELVVGPGIAGPSALKGKAIAVPSADGPQAIALSYWLTRQHLARPGQVSVVSAGSGASAVTEFTSGRVAGAWVTAPYDVEMVQAGGKVLASEASIWPGGQFAVTNLVVRASYLDAHTSTVMSLLQAQVRSNEALHGSPLLVVTAADAELQAVTGTATPPGIFASSMSQLTFTNDPIVATLPTEAQRATAGGLPSVTGNLAGLYYLTPLDLVLRLNGQQPVLQGG